MDSSKKPIKTQRKIIALFVFLTLSALVISILLKNSSSSSSSSGNHHHHATPSLSSFIKKACSQTLYSSLCRSTFSTPKNLTNFLDIIGFSINRTTNHVTNARMDIVAHFSDQDLNTREKNALQDCMQMLDQTSYELKQAMDELASATTSSSYGNIKALLSGAMTNENTCINGFFHLQEMDLDNRKGNGEHLRKLLSPISHMISNTLALIKTSQETVKKPKMMKMITKRHRGKFARTRKSKTLTPNVTVASDGSGNYRMIGDAIGMAPNMSKTTYIIKIKAGIYKENLMIPRDKINIMLLGDGMNSTIITGSRNFIDGFSTFGSATLTVMGDKFLARDITVENTAPPEKYQAVALMVTTNAAFSRCEIKSLQDTLYAHSLRQLYQHCIIQGTIDFIFGNAAAVFQNCRILARKPIPGQRNTITAQGREDPNQNTGISLQNCTIDAAKEFNLTERKNFSTYLGRPWRSYSRVVVVNSYLGDLIHPRGWLEWTDYSSLDTVEYSEYMNSGPGADTRRRINWAGYRKNCSLDVVKKFEVEEFLHGTDNWLENTVLPMFSSS